MARASRQPEEDANQQMWDPNVPLVFLRRVPPNPRPNFRNPYLWPELSHWWCRKCNLHGHYTEDCPYPGAVCYNCYQPGHIAPACSHRSRRGPAGQVRCHSCGSYGHQQRYCPDPRPICYRCHERGHRAAACQAAAAAAPTPQIPLAATIRQPEENHEGNRHTWRQANNDDDDDDWLDDNWQVAENNDDKDWWDEPPMQAAAVTNDDDWWDEPPAIQQPSEPSQPEEASPSEPSQPEEASPSEPSQPEEASLLERSQPEANRSEPVPCVVCMDRLPERICTPCGHYCVCLPCAEELLKQDMSFCPICRHDVLVFCPLYTL